MKIGHGWLNLSMCDFLFFTGMFWYFSNDRGENNLSTSLPLLNMNKSPTDRVLQQPQAAFSTGHLSLYLPERAGGHLQCGWGQTYSHRCDPHWCKWQPDETASPLLCHYRGWEQVQWASVQNPRRTHTECEWIAEIIAVILCRWICPWWQRFIQELKGRAGLKWSLFSCVCIQSLQWLLESKQDGHVGMMPRTKFIWWQRQRGWYLWMNVPVICWGNLGNTLFLWDKLIHSYYTYVYMHAQIRFKAILFSVPEVFYSWSKDTCSIQENSFNAIIPIYIITCTKELLCGSCYVTVIGTSHHQGSLWVWCAVLEGNLVKVLVCQAELGWWFTDIQLISFSIRLAIVLGPCDPDICVFCLDFTEKTTDP